MANLKKLLEGLKQEKLGLTLATLAVVLSVLSSRLEMYQLGMASIAVMCSLVVLTLTKKAGTKVFPIIIYSIGLSLLFQISLLSDQLLGMDIHLEHFFAYKVLTEGWDTQFPHPGNSSIMSNVWVPYLSRITGVSIVWILKTLPHILFPIVPVILFKLFQRWVSEYKAFLAAIFFVIMPSFFMELVSIPKEEIAEIFFAGMLFLLLASNLRTRYKLPSLITVSVLAMLTHYSIGAIIGIFLLIGIVVKLILKVKDPTPNCVYGILIVVLLVTGGLYYSRTSSGTPLRYMTAVIPTGIPGTSSWEDRPVIDIGPIDIGPVTHEERVEPAYIIEESSLRYIEHHEVLVREAMGTMFLKSSSVSKVFWGLQFFMQVMIVLGFIKLWRNKKKDFFIIGTPAALILILCLALPGISAILNATRFFHIALFALAPCAVEGMYWVTKKPKIVANCVLVGYFFFTSGFVFEALKLKSTYEPAIPFSVNLTNHRIDLGGSLTNNDAKVRDWLVEQNWKVVYSDLPGNQLLSDKIGLTRPIKILGMESPDKVEKNSYVFIRERSSREESMVLWGGVGLREIVSLTADALAPTLEGREVIYQIGDAKVLGEQK